MTLRYYIAPMTGDGSDATPYRPGLPEGVDYVSLIPSNPDGSPSKQWVLCLVNATDHSLLEADNTLIALPLGPETPMSTIPNNQRNQYLNRLSQNGYPITIDWANDLAVDVVERLAQVAEPGYVHGGMGIGGKGWG